MTTTKRTPVKTNEQRARHQTRTQANNWAHSELADRHRDEFRALYRYYCEQLGLEPHKARNNRPPADGGSSPKRGHRVASETINTPTDKRSRQHAR